MEKHQKTIILCCTMDTKSNEGLFLKKELERDSFSRELTSCSPCLCSRFCSVATQWQESFWCPS